MGISLVCMSIPHVYDWCPWRPEMDVRSFETGGTDGCEPLSMWELGIKLKFFGGAASALNH